MNQIITEDYRQMFGMFNHTRYSKQFSDQHYKRVERFARDLDAETILDWGAGEGLLQREFVRNGTIENFDFKEYDPCIIGKDKKRPDKADLVTCINVLEYVEDSCLKGVIYEIVNRALKGLYIVISLVDDGQELAPETRAMRREKTAEWWVNRISSQFKNLPITNVAIERDKVMIWIDKT